MKTFLILFCILSYSVYSQGITEAKITDHTVAKIEEKTTCDTSFCKIAMGDNQYQFGYCISTWKILDSKYNERKLISRKYYIYREIQGSLIKDIIEYLVEQK